LVQLAIAVLTAVITLAQSPVDLVRQKRYAEARKALAGIQEPADVKQRISFHRLKAAIASGLGEHAHAADEMEAALALAPAAQDLLLATAVAELQAGRLERALQHASSVPTAQGFAICGDIHERRREYVAAAKAYQKAVELAPDVEAYRMALALELVQHATFEPARVVLDQAIAIFPRSAKLKTLLAITQYALGDMDKAESALLNAIAADPKSDAAHRYLAEFALQSPKAPEPAVVAALCAWDKVVCAAMRLRLSPEDASSAALLRQSDGAMARCELARSYERRDDWAAARRELETCVRLDPAPQNHYRLGRVYQRLGLSELAIRQMQLYRQQLQKQTEEAARREQAVQAFRVTVR
jgi:tetratricopeptide (TPR) repeat protein